MTPYEKAFREAQIASNLQITMELLRVLIDKMPRGTVDVSHYSAAMGLAQLAASLVLGGGTAFDEPYRHELFCLVDANANLGPRADLHGPHAELASEIDKMFRQE